MSASIRCLVVGLPATRIAEDNQRFAEAISIGFSEIPDYLPLPPSLELVVAPLFASDFDALELIELIGAKGFRGSLRVVAPDLPNRGAVLRELRSHAVRKGISVEMVEET